jgi:hypothetical protein
LGDELEFVPKCKVKEGRKMTQADAVHKPEVFPGDEWKQTVASGRYHETQERRAHEPLATADSWAEELSRLDPCLQQTVLAQDWASHEGAWTELKAEWERLRRIKTDVAWLASDAAERIEKKLSSVGKLIDQSQKEDRRENLMEAAIGLSAAESMIQRAWLSRWYNRWHVRIPPVPAAWQWISFVVIGALAVNAYLIARFDLYPSETPMDLSDALFAAALWGFGGGLILALKTVHERVQRQEFEIHRVAWYFLSPLLGLTFGAIAFLFFLAGLLTTGQTSVSTGPSEQTTLDPTPILLLALVAGFTQNAFIDFVSGTAGRIYTHQKDES